MKPVNNDVASSIILKSYKSEQRKRLLLDFISNLEGTHCFPCRLRTFSKCSKNNNLNHIPPGPLLSLCSNPPSVSNVEERVGFIRKDLGIA